MRSSDFTHLVDTTFARLRALHAVKAGEYAKDDDKLANFKEAGRQLNLLPEQVLLVYLNKHYSAVANYVQDLATGTARTRSEPIEGRLDDLMVYCLLLAALLAERQQAPISLQQLFDSLTPVPAPTPVRLQWDDSPSI